MNRVVRLPDGRFITRKVVESDPEQLAKAKPEEIWLAFYSKSNSGKTRYTRPVLIRDMDERWLSNAMRIVRDRMKVKMIQLGLITHSDFENTALAAETALTKYALQNDPQFRTMHEELQYKLGFKKRGPEPVPEHTGRKFDFS